ncbi:transcriptional protein SWT1 [Fopius arisanus]|uniref:Swt1 protein n=1 Tax=Fopius arisanus TaxID=64838 RepID=A0A0C9QSP9_9HYME|nr:PREDICTED: transcriptional protein SWT1 [Fopius arisanus]
MDQGTLPKYWIAVPSKQRPDRVYYFNKKTNQTSWERPGDSRNEPSEKMSKMMKKRRNEDDEVPTEPNTPGKDSPPPKTERPKLKARRTLLVKANDQEPSVSNETPQMKALRQKILERQSKANVSKKGKNTTVLELKTPTKKANAETKIEEHNHKSSMNVTLTPLMKEIYEKKKAREALAKTKKSERVVEDPPKADEDPPKEETLRRGRSRAKSIGPAPTPVVTLDVNDFSLSRNRRRTMYIPSTTQRQKSGSDTECTIKPSQTLKFSKKSMTPQPKRNLAKERIEKLRRSLVVEDPDEDTPHSKKMKKSPEKQIPKPSLSTIEKSTFHDVYNTAEARMQALKERLQKEAEKAKEEIHNSSKIPPSFSLPSRDSEDGRREPLALQELSFDEEAMDWEPIEDDIIMQEIEAVRHALFNDLYDVPMEEHPEKCGLDLVDGQVESNRHALYIVIDTNVFLSNIQAVEQARDTVFKTHGRPIIVIPWTVIRELDYIKDGKTNSRPESLKSKARQAVRFIHRHFSDKHPRVLGQTARDVINNREMFAIECPDDEILQTCLQIQKSCNTVVLLSYDKNLCNKAMIHDVVTLGRNDPLEKVDYLTASEFRSESLLSSHLNQTGNNPRSPTTTQSKELSVAEDIFEDIKDIVKDFLTVVVAKEMQNLYGENWGKYVIIPPPWTTITVLKCAIKHWMAAVNDSFIRRAEPLLKELHDLINKYEMKRGLRDVEHVIDITYDLIQCLIVKKYPNLIQRIEIAVQELRKKHCEAVQDIREEKLRDKIEREGDKELEARAERVFRRFDEIYSFARDLCGAACESVGMPCSFYFRKLEPPPDDDHIRNIQPEIAASLNRLLLVLSRALEDLPLLHKDHRSVLALYDSLENFLSDHDPEETESISPMDVHACLKYKEKNLRLGVPQLQQLIDHFCRLATFRCR